ncbi:MAG: cadherin repeat domain-containing protein [Pseudomonadota bacterium]
MTPKSLNTSRLVAILALASGALAACSDDDGPPPGAAPVFTSGAAGTAIDEETTGVVYDAEATDADGDTVTFALAGPNAGMFSIDPSTGVITLTAGVDADITPGVLSFGIADFVFSPVFNDVTDLDVEIALEAPLIAGPSYNDPALIEIDYNVFGVLTQTTPSGFPAFDLQREIFDEDFYEQGSSLAFMIDAAADLSDGLQVSELAGTGAVFTFDGREVGNGRYHPAQIILNADGTGLFQNSNNTGGVNPGNGMVVDVDFGDEYVIDLSFTPTGLTIADADQFAAVSSVDIDVVATGGGRSATQTITIPIMPVNDAAPAFISGPWAAFPENASGAAYQAVAVDADGGAPTYAIVSGADQALFSIDAASGEVSFITTPDFENPGDADGDNSYEIVIRASDGTNTDDRAVSIVVGPAV